MPMPSPRQMSPGFADETIQWHHYFWNCKSNCIVCCTCSTLLFHFLGMFGTDSANTVQTYLIVNHRDPCPREQSDPPGLFWPSLDVKVRKGAALLAVDGSGCDVWFCHHLDAKGAFMFETGKCKSIRKQTRPWWYYWSTRWRMQIWMKVINIIMCPPGSNLQANIAYTSLFQTHQTAFRVRLSAVMIGERQPRQPRQSNQPEPLAPGTCQPQQGTSTQAGFHALQGISAEIRANIWCPKKTL